MASENVINKCGVYIGARFLNSQNKGVGNEQRESD